MPVNRSTIKRELAHFRRGQLDVLARHTTRALRPVPAAYRRRWRLSLGRWLSFHQRELLKEDGVTWMGVTISKIALDLWIYQEIIYETRPDVIVEIGSAYGGSALFFANLMDVLGHGRVVSVDIDRSRWCVEHDRIDMVTGESGAPDTVAQVRELCQAKSVMLSQDGDHTKDGVLRDLRAYADLVTPGNYVVVEDTIADVLRPGSGLGHLDPGPLAAVEAFLAEDDRFEIDPSRERYLLTYNPRGYLRRRTQR